MVLDGKTVIAGGIKFTSAAQESNAENLPVIHDAELAEQYRATWERRKAVSIPYTGPLEVAPKAEQ